jgi:hypothetical protein
VSSGDHRDQDQTSLLETYTTQFVCEHIAKYCRVCDEAPQTVEAMSHLAHLKDGFAQTCFTTVIQQVVQGLQSEFDWVKISFSLADLMLYALTLVEKGFANNVFIHSLTAAR